ncbi:MAG: sulfurtransferase [Burkholderiales bacterium PBB4]|nr:MAG: sulfurtransferase [Burkholderiales bacterium PBB4]
MNWLKNLLNADEKQAPTWLDNALVLDVRSEAEFSMLHVNGALNAPLAVFASDYMQMAPDKSRQIIVYCASGARSGQAAQFLKSQGYSSVINGISARQVAKKLNRQVVC